MATNYDKDYQRSGYSEKDWDGSTVHYDKDYRVTGHSEKDWDGSTVHYDKDYHVTGHSEKDWDGSTVHYDKDYHVTGHSEKNWDGSVTHYDKDYRVIGYSEAPESYQNNSYTSSAGGNASSGPYYKYYPSPRQQKYGPVVHKITSVLYISSIVVLVLLGIYVAAAFFKKGEIAFYGVAFRMGLTLAAFVACFAKNLDDEEINLINAFGVLIASIVLSFVTGQVAYNLQGYNASSAGNAMNQMIYNMVGAAGGIVMGSVLGFLLSKCIFMENRRQLRSLLSIVVVLLLAIVAAVRGFYPASLPFLAVLPMSLFLVLEIGVIFWRFFAGNRAGYRKPLLGLAEDAIWAIYFTYLNLRMADMVRGLREYLSMVLRDRHCQIFLGLLVIAGIAGMVVGSVLRKGKKKK